MFMIVQKGIVIALTF